MLIDLSYLPILLWIISNWHVMSIDAILLQPFTEAKMVYKEVVYLTPKIKLLFVRNSDDECTVNNNGNPLVFEVLYS